MKTLNNFFLKSVIMFYWVFTGVTSTNSNVNGGFVDFIQVQLCFSSILGFSVNFIMIDKTYWIILGFQFKYQKIKFVRIKILNYLDNLK